MKEILSGELLKYEIDGRVGYGKIGCISSKEYMLYDDYGNGIGVCLIEPYDALELMLTGSHERKDVLIQRVADKRGLSSLTHSLDILSKYEEGE